MKAILDKQNVITKLQSQPFVPYNVIGILENTENKGYIDEATQSVWVENDYFNYITGCSEIIEEKIESLEDGFYGFSGVKVELAQAIYKKWFLHWYEPTERFVSSGVIPSVESPYQVVKVPFEEARGIDDRYEFKQDGSFDKIKVAILNRPSSAIYLDGEIASYVLIHDDNSIGYMYTQEKHRQVGLGYWTSLDILKQINARGDVPFLEINASNFKSQGLARKLGFEKDAATPWFGIIKGVPEWFKTWDPLKGESFIFSSMAHLRRVDCLTTPLKAIKFEKEDERYMGSIDEGDLRAEFVVELDESKEAYVLKVNTLENMDYYELVKALSVHFPDHNCSLILPYEKTLIGKIGGIIVEK